MKKFSEWFSMFRQTPWEPGVYEVLRFGTTPADLVGFAVGQVRYSYWDGHVWSAVASTMAQAVWNVQLENKYTRCEFWRGLTQEYAAHIKASRGW